MAKKELYNILQPQSNKNEYLCLKYDALTLAPLNEDTGGYKLSRGTYKDGSPKFECDCYAGLQGKHCRHKEMLEIFLDANAINTRKLYEFDKHRWVSQELPSPGEEDS